MIAMYMLDSVSVAYYKHYQHVVLYGIYDNHLTTYINHGSVSNYYFPRIIEVSTIL